MHMINLQQNFVFLLKAFKIIENYFLGKNKIINLFSFKDGLKMVLKFKMIYYCIKRCVFWYKQPQNKLIHIIMHFRKYSVSVSPNIIFSTKYLTTIHFTCNKQLLQLARVAGNFTVEKTQNFAFQKCEYNNAIFRTKFIVFQGIFKLLSIFYIYYQPIYIFK